MNDHDVEKTNNLTFKLSLLSVNITAKFHYFNMKTGKCYMEDEKSHEFSKYGPKTDQMTS